MIETAAVVGVTLSVDSGWMQDEFGAYKDQSVALKPGHAGRGRRRRLPRPPAVTRQRAAYTLGLGKSPALG